MGEWSPVITNQKPENLAFSPLIGRNLRPFSDSDVLYFVSIRERNLPL